MKPLNRPMFRYGGPIKEGIMTGMKDNMELLLVIEDIKTDGRSHHARLLRCCTCYQVLRIGALRAVPKLQIY